MPYDRRFFKKDEEGNLVYFPHSFWGRGYVLVGDAKERILSRTSQSAALAPLVGLALPAAILGGLLLFDLTPMQLVWWCLMLIAPAIGSGWLVAHRQVQGLPVSRTRYTIADYVLAELAGRSLRFYMVAGAVLAAIGATSLLLAVFSGSTNVWQAMLIMLGLYGLVSSLLAWGGKRMLDRARREGRFG